MTNAYQVARRYIGQTVGTHPINTGECTGLVDTVTRDFGFRLLGNGNQIGIANDVSQWADVIPYRAGMEFKVGDIFSTNEPGSPYGHTFVYGGGNTDSMLIVEQNFNGIRSVIEHRRAMKSPILRIVRIKGQSNYTPTDQNGAQTGNGKNYGGGIARQFFEITCDKVEGIKSPGDPTVIETFYKCNKISGTIDGNWVIYDKYDGSIAYVPRSCVKERTDYSSYKAEEKKTYDKANTYQKFSDKTEDGIDQSGTQAIYSLAQFISLGRINYGNNEWTYSSGSSFPDNVKVPGKGYNAYGFLSDGDGNIILSAPKEWGDVMGRTYDTPFGYKGKVYTTNEKTSLDVYVR